MDIDHATKVLEAHADYRVLRRLRIDDAQVFADNVGGESCGRLAVIDTETTGLKADLGNRIIDLAIATCEYGRKSGRLYRVVDRYESLEDPEAPIPPEITRLTGITDAMVRGRRIDEAGIARASRAAANGLPLAAERVRWNRNAYYNCWRTHPTKHPNATLFRTTIEIARINPRSGTNHLVRQRGARTAHLRQHRYHPAR